MLQAHYEILYHFCMLFASTLAVLPNLTVRHAWSVWFQVAPSASCRAWQKTLAQHIAHGSWCCHWQDYEGHDWPPETSEGMKAWGPDVLKNLAAEAVYVNLSCLAAELGLFAAVAQAALK